MHKVKFIIALIISFSAYSQNEKLYYFIENDSLLGVKSENGKIIISPKVQGVFGPRIYDGSAIMEIKENIFFLYPKDGNAEAYNRIGKYLFEPYIFDFDIDSFEEGFMRITRDKKMGLANKQGQIIIPPKYDFISSVNFGIIQYCNGCYRDYKKDEEHPPLVGGTWGYLDKEGNEIQLIKVRKHPKDIVTKEGLFIPYQFKYNKTELEILNFFEKRKKSIIKTNNLKTPIEEILFEIVEKPTELEPYYIIRTYRIYKNFVIGSDDSDDFQNFKVSGDLKKFYVVYFDLVNHNNYSEYIEKKVLVDDWLKKTKK